MGAPPSTRPPRPYHPSAIPSICAVLVTWLIVGGMAQAQSAWVRQSSKVPNSLGGVSYGNGTYVAVGAAAAAGQNGGITTSSDGLTWAAVDSGNTASLRAIVYAGGQFVAAGTGATILTSPDGTTWTTQTTGLPTSTPLSGLAFGNGLFVAVGGGGGTIITSPDAITWTPTESGTGSFLQSVHHAAGLFVATGAFGTILTSADGISWSPPLSLPSPVPFYLTASTYFAGRYYAVGLGGDVLSSPDGTNWSYETSGILLNLLTNLRSIGTDGTTAVICGDNGTLLTSTDGTLWNPVASGQTVALRGITFAEGKFVVVGEPHLNDGVILVGERDAGILWNSSAVSVDEDAGTVTLTIDRLGPTSSTASVNFQTVAGSATEGIDFTPSAGTANFGDESSVDVEITIANNPEAELPEAFTVTLSAPAPAGLLLYNPVTATVTIVDAQDSDSDGLPDDWEILHFEDVESYGAADDPDGDGNSNARELADGTDPDDQDSASYNLTIGVASGLGAVAASPNLGTYPRGTTVTLTPTPTGEFTFVAWQGDASGAADPLVFDITSDLAIEATFEVSLTDALDDPCLAWTVSGSGAPWTGQGMVAFDGADAAETGGLSIGEQSSIETSVYGPAELTFRWRVSTSQFDSYRFFIDGTPRATLSTNNSWHTDTFFIGSGSHTLRWTYAKNSTSGAGSNQAWLDQVALTYRFEDWQKSYFNAAERADPAIGGPLGDPNNDGRVNLLDYLFDLHPRFPDRASPNLPTVSFEDSGGQKFAAITWSHHHKRIDNVAITVEFSTTLQPGSWQAVAAPMQLISAAGAIETVRVTNPTPITPDSRGFFRLSVTLLP